MLRFLVLLSLFISVGFSKEFVDEISIFIYGDVGYFEYVFNALAMIFGSDSFKHVSIVGMGVFMVLKFWAMQKERSLEIGIKDLITLGILSMLVANQAMTITVKIFDKRADHGKMEYVDGNGNPMPTFAAVANVPWIIGLSAGTISYLRYGLVEVLETATSTIGPDLSFAQVGFLQNYKTMKEVILNTDLASGSEEMLAFRANIVEYVGQCVLRQAAPVNNRVLDIFTKPPTGHTLDALVPANVGLTDANKIAPPDGGAEVSCVDFFTDNIEDKAEDMAIELYNNLKDKIKPLNLDTMGDALSDTFGAKASSAMIAGSNDLVSYMMNAAIIEPMEAAKGFDQLGLVSPTEGINKSAAAMAKRTLQTGTTGNLMWMSEILPYALTFISGIVYAVGIFPLLFYLFTGNPAVIFTYVKSIISIELVHFGMAITHNATSFYSANKAQDILISMFADENAGNATTLLPQLEYLATMTGVAGTIGVIVALGVPMLVMRGEVGGMLGALNALAGRYNNDARTVRDQQAQAWEGKRMREENEASDYLKSLGISAPKGVGDMEYANRIRQGMDNMGRAYASMVATSQPHDKGYMQGATTGAVNQVGNTVGMGTSGVNVSQAMMAGQLMGASSGGNMMGLANSGLTVQQAAMSGKLQGAQQGGSMMGLANSGTTQQQASDAGFLAGKSQGIGMQEQAKHKDNAQYYAGVRTSEASKLESTAGLGRLSPDKASDYISASGKQSEWKAREMIGDTAGKEKAAEQLKQAGQSVADALEEVAHNISATKTAGSFGTSRAINDKGISAAIGLSEEGAHGQQTGAFAMTQAQVELFGSAGKAQTVMANQRMHDMHAGYTAGKDAGYRTEGGGLTAKGRAASELQTLSQIMPSMNRADVFGSKEGKKNFLETLASSQNMSVEEFTKAEFGMSVEEFMGQNAQEFGAQIFGRQGTVFASHAQMAMNTGGMATVAFSETMGSSAVKDGSSSATDNSHIETSGNKSTHYNDVKELINTKPEARVALMAAKTDQEAADILAGYDMTKWAANYKNVAAMGGTVGIKKALESLGVDMDADSMGLAMGVAGGGVAGGGALIALEKATYDKSTGKGWVSTKYEQALEKIRGGSSSSTSNAKPVGDSQNQPMDGGDNHQQTKNNESVKNNSQNTPPNSNSSPNSTTKTTGAQFSATAPDGHNPLAPQKRGSYRGIKGLAVGLGLAMFTNDASASDVFSDIGGQIADIGKAAAGGNFKEAGRLTAQFGFGDAAGNDITAAAHSLGRGDIKGAVGGAVNAIGNFGEDLHNLGITVSNKAFGTNFAHQDYIQDRGTQYLQEQGLVGGTQSSRQQTPLQEAVAKVDGNALMEEQEQMQKEQRSLNVENNVMETKTRSDQALGAIEDMAEKLEETQAQLKEVSRKRIIVAPKGGD